MSQSQMAQIQIPSSSLVPVRIYFAINEFGKITSGVEFGKKAIFLTALMAECKNSHEHDKLQCQLYLASVPELFCQFVRKAGKLDDFLVQKYRAKSTLGLHWDRLIEILTLNVGDATSVLDPTVLKYVKQCLTDVRANTYGKRYIDHFQHYLGELNKPNQSQEDQVKNQVCAGLMFALFASPVSVHQTTRQLVLDLDIPDPETDTNTTADAKTDTSATAVTTTTVDDAIAAVSTTADTTETSVAVADPIPPVDVSKFNDAEFGQVFADLIQYAISIYKPKPFKKVVDEDNADKEELKKNLQELKSSMSQLGDACKMQ